MPVFSLFFCGTSSNSGDTTSNPETAPNGELVSRLYERCDGVARETKAIIDGPGSGNHQEGEKIRGTTNYSTLRGVATGAGWDENVMFAIDIILGRIGREAIEPAVGRSWIKDADASRCSNAACNKGFGLMTRRHHCRLCGKVFCDACTSQSISIKKPLAEKGYLAGTHAKQKVCVACFLDNEMRSIELDRAAADKVDSINCIGWSRGAVTCGMFANACLAEARLAQKDIRIVAVDPVPGGSERGANKVELKSNVKKYVAFYARDERTKMFSPTLPAVQCDLTVYFLPGNHSSLVGYTGRNQTLYKSALVVRHISEQWLVKWGTRFTKRLYLTDDEMLRYYDCIVGGRDHYTRLQQASILKLPGTLQSGGRTMYTPNPGQAYIGLDVYDPDPEDEFFVNWHHADLLRAHFPRVCGILSRGISRQHFEAAKEEVRQELHRMIYQKQCPWIGRKVGRMLGVNV